VLISVAKDPHFAKADQSKKPVTFAGPILTPITATDDPFGHAIHRHTYKNDNRNTVETLGANVTIPVTTVDELLGPDKGRVAKPANTNNTSEACRKSELILSKFWADAMDSDHASDSTQEPDTVAEGPQIL